MEPRVETKQMEDGTWTAWSESMGVGISGGSREEALENLAAYLDTVIHSHHDRFKQLRTALGTEGMQ